MRYLFAVMVVMWIEVAGARGEAVRVVEAGEQVVMGNGEVEITFSKKTMQVTSLKYQKGGGGMMELGTPGRALYFDMNASAQEAGGAEKEGAPKAGYQGVPAEGRRVRVMERGPERGEIAVTGGPGKFCPFEVEFRLTMFREVPGVYAWAVYRHGAGMEAGKLGQTRFVVRGVPGDGVFTHHVVDEARKGPFPIGKVVDVVQDATERLADGTVYTKYDNSQFTYGYEAQGMAGAGPGRVVGLWMVWPSTEFSNGGLLRQDWTVHKDGVVMAMFQSGHFGAGGIEVKRDEVWSKVYGPVLVYVNEGKSVDGMWADAKARAKEERAAWPYAWVGEAGYAKERGTVKGRLVLKDGASTEGAWVVLSPAEEAEGGVTWMKAAKGYQFWARAGKDGSFEFGKVRPGKYVLTASGADQFEDFAGGEVEVGTGKVADLGVKEWEPVTFGKRVWQIGVADRSGAEFRDGKEPEYRGYEAFKQYFKAFPEEVTFTIGKSKEREDWNFALWNWYTARKYWVIKFELAEAPAGEGTLTLGLNAAYAAGGLVVGVNGKPGVTVEVPRTGSAAYRSGAVDSMYVVRRVTMPAGVLRKGGNEVRIAHRSMEVMPPMEEVDAKHFRPRGVMWDAVRLEVR